MKTTGPATATRGTVVDMSAHRKMANAVAARAEMGPLTGELASFFEFSLDLLCIAGLDGYFRRVNTAWTTALGWPLETLVAMPMFDLIHPEDRAASRAEVTKLAAGAATIQFENRCRHRDGSYRWLQWNARPMPQDGLIYAVARDISRQKWLERENLGIADREKDRLARELHDGLCQHLAGIAALSLTLSKKLTECSEPAFAQASAEITRLLNETISEARDMAHGLDPVGLKEIGLHGALETLALTVEHRLGVACVFTCDRPFPAVAYESGAHLFRIAQEAINNAVTHGKARRIQIDLCRGAAEGVMNIYDDGTGIPEKLCKLGGSGMHTMSYRARTIGGSLSVRRRGARGTVVTCSFPILDTLE